MATTLTLRPTSTVQLGTSNTVTGAASAHAALSDNSTASYVQLIGRSRISTQVTRVGFTAPSIPSGAKVISVKLRRQILSVLDTDVKPRCNHWFRCTGQPLTGVGGAVQTAAVDVLADYFTSEVPVSTGSTAWTTETVAEFDRGPDGNEWNPATNLAAFTYDLGRDDTAATVLRIAEVYLDIHYQQQSGVTATAPTGTVTTTCRPTITWTYTSADSQPQEAYRVVVYTQAQHDAVGFTPFVTTPTLDSGWTLGETLQWIPDADLVNGTWWAYVQARAKYDGPSEFLTTVGSTSWTQSMSGAPVATLSAVADTVNNRVRLTFSPSTSSPTTTAYAVQVARGTGLWGPVRGGVLTPASGMTPIVLDDHEHLLNATNRYRVLSYGTSGSVLIPASAYSAEASVTPAAESWWLVDPQNPIDKITLPVQPKGDPLTFEQVAGIFKPATGTGVVDKFVVRGVSYTPDGELTIFFSICDNGEALWTTFQRMRTSGRTLLLQKPHGENAYIAIGVGSQAMKVEYDSRSGRRVQYRKVTCPYTSTSAPPITT